MDVRRSIKRYGFFLLAITFFVVFFYGSFAAFISYGFRSESIAQYIADFQKLLSSSRILAALRFTLLESFCSAFFSLLLALPLAVLMARVAFRGKQLLSNIALLNFVLPSLLVIVALISFYGKSGLLSRVTGITFTSLYSFSGIIWAHVFYNIALALVILMQAFQRIDPRYLEMGRSLKASRWQLFSRIELPLVLPGMITAFFFIFVYSFFSFSIILVFGGLRFRNLEYYLYYFTSIKYAPVQASQLALVQFAFSFLFIWATSRMIKVNVFSLQSSSHKQIPFRCLPKPQKVILLGLIALYLILFVLPLFSVVLDAFKLPQNWGLDNFTALWSPNFARSLGVTLQQISHNSFILSTLVALAATLAALGLSRILPSHSAWISFFMMPFGISGVTVALGLSLLYRYHLSPFILIMIFQFFLTFPLAFRIVKNAVDSFDQRYLEIASSLGAQKRQAFFKVELPLFLPPLLMASLLSFAISFADFTGVLILGQGKIVTFPIAIFRLVSHYHYRQSSALATIYLGICLLVFMGLYLGQKQYQKKLKK